MAPELVEELEWEVLLRIPADDPATLVRASLACKRWRRLIHDDPAFRRRLRELHRPPPPLLGFACNLGSVSEFVPSSTTCAPTTARRRGWRCLDARHGRVLLCGAPLQVGRNPLDAAALVVWDPISDERRELPKLPPNARADNQSWNAAVLCAAGRRADDSNHAPHFTVVLVCRNGSQMCSYVYSSESNSWSERAYLHDQAPQCVLHLAPSLLIGNALHFPCRYSKGILKYNLDTREVSLIALPDECHYKCIVLMSTEDGRLGFATVVDSNLFLCSSAVSFGGRDLVWSQSRFVQLKALLPVGAYSSSLDVVGFADGVRLVFLWTVDGIYTIDLMTGSVKKVYKDTSVYGVFPCVSFCTQGICAE